VTRPVESVAADLCGHYRHIALLLDRLDVEADSYADELAVAPSPDRIRPDELPTPVVHDAAVGECREERLGVVGIRRLEQLGDWAGSRFELGGHCLTHRGVGRWTDIVNIAEAAMAEIGSERPRIEVSVAV
jgi:hypothetical protein